MTPAPESAPQPPIAKNTSSAALDIVWLVSTLALTLASILVFANAGTGSASLGPVFFASVLALLAYASFYLRAIVWLITKIYRRFRPPPPESPKRGRWLDVVIVTGVLASIFLPNYGPSLYKSATTRSPQSMAAGLLEGGTSTNEENYRLAGSAEALEWGLEEAERAGKDPTPLVRVICGYHVDMTPRLNSQLESLLEKKSLQPKVLKRLEETLAKRRASKR
jgi:hypothetical protein